MITRLVLGPADHGRPLTWEEFNTANGQEGYKYELIRGRLEVSPLANMPHDLLQLWLGRNLEAYRQEHPELIGHLTSSGRVLVTEEADATVPEPDWVAFAESPHDRPIAECRWEDFTPILVAEILSEDTADKDLERNVELYLQVPSIREYWIVDPRENADQPTLIVYRRRGQRWQRPIVVPFGEVYTSPRFLPDFSLLVDPHR